MRWRRRRNYSSPRGHRQHCRMRKREGWKRRESQRRRGAEGRRRGWPGQCLQPHVCSPADCSVMLGPWGFWMDWDREHLVSQRVSSRRCACGRADSREQSSQGALTGYLMLFHKPLWIMLVHSLHFCQINQDFMTYECCSFFSWSSFSCGLCTSVQSEQPQGVPFFFFNFHHLFWLMLYWSQMLILSHTYTLKFILYQHKYDLVRTMLNRNCTYRVL